MRRSIGMPYTEGAPMKIKVQLQEIAMVAKPHQQIEHLSFTLAEAKFVLKMLQQHLVEQQATAFVAAHASASTVGSRSGSKSITRAPSAR
jgi:hypothetical protein